jgi:hypothetical protein
MAEIDDSAELPLGLRIVGVGSTLLGVMLFGLVWQRWLVSHLWGLEAGLLERVPFLLLGLVLGLSGTNLLATSSKAWRSARLGFFLSAPALLVLGLAFFFRALQASFEEPKEHTARVVAEFPWGGAVALIWTVVALVTAIRLGKYVRPNRNTDRPQNHPP